MNNSAAIMEIVKRDQNSLDPEVKWIILVELLFIPLLGLLIVFPIQNLFLLLIQQLFYQMVLLLIVVLSWSPDIKAVI